VRSPEVPARRPRRRRRLALVAGVIVIVCTAGGVGAWRYLSDDGAGTPQAPESSAPTALAEVTRQTLTQHLEENGKLGYAGNYTVINRTDGTLTKLPSTGAVIRHGKVLYRVDGKPVFFLQGVKTPAYRALYRGLKGNDVRQLNAELVDLGYGDDYDLSAKSEWFSWATYKAVKELQDSVGATETGRLDLGQVVFLKSEQIRITEVKATYGAAAPTGQPLLQATSTTPQITVPLDVDQAGNVKVGNKVGVSLPNGKDATGVVKSIGRVATTNAQGSTLPVVVRLTRPNAGAGLDSATVRVTITSARAKNALSVPVTALLATAGGDYQVEVVDAANARRLIPVKTGLFDDVSGMVQVTGPGLAEGQRVVVPAS
jgi:hypothetical protein